MHICIDHKAKCGEGACSRWTAKRSQHQSTHSSRENAPTALRLLRNRAGASSLATVPLFVSAANTLVVGVFFLRMVGHVTHTLELGNALEQGALDAFAKGDVCLAAALATAAELQHGDAVVDHIDQADLTAVAGEPRVDLGLQVIVD